MSKPLPIVAQNAMDQYYAQFKSANDFFGLEDFIFACGACLGEYYLQNFEAMRTLLRAEKKDEVVGFSHDWLAEKYLKVENDKGILFSTIDFDFMSFPYDKQDTGIQNIFSTNGVELERINVDSFWMFKLLPATNRVFWWIEKGRIRYYKKGDCSINQIKVTYVPGINNEMEVPDSLVEYAIKSSVTRIKDLVQGNVVKKSLDQNQNKVLQTEIDPSALKPPQ